MAQKTRQRFSEANIKSRQLVSQVETMGLSDKRHLDSAAGLIQGEYFALHVIDAITLTQYKEKDIVIPQMISRTLEPGLYYGHITEIQISGDGYAHLFPTTLI